MKRPAPSRDPDWNETSKPADNAAAAAITTRSEFIPSGQNQTLESAVFEGQAL